MSDADLDRYFRLLRLASSAEDIGATDRAADLRRRAERIIPAERARRLGMSAEDF